MFNPFIRLKQVSGEKRDVNANHIVDFGKNETGTIVQLADGRHLTVVESDQAVRGAIRRAFNPKSSAEAADQPTEQA